MKKTGTQMTGIVDTNKVKSIPCDCTRCYHSEKMKSSIKELRNRYCKYYDLVSPNKKRCARYYPVRPSSQNQSKKKKDWAELVEKSKKQLAEQKLHYKDKPVNGEPTDRQINALKRFCYERNLNVSIIGMNRSEATKILAYFFNKTGIEIKPKCFDKYITEKKKID